MLSRRRFLGGAAGAWLVLPPAGAGAQEGSFMQAEEAPRQLFPEASEITERTIPTTPNLQQRVRALLSRPPTLWETAYRVFTAKQGASLVGFVIVVEEIGKHRPITYAIAVKPDGTVQDAAVLAYREAYGGYERLRLGEPFEPAQPPRRPPRRSPICLSGPVRPQSTQLVDAPSRCVRSDGGARRRLLAARSAARGHAYSFCAHPCPRLCWRDT